MRQAVCVNTPIPERRNKQSPLTRRHLASLKGTCPYYRPNKKVRYAAGIRKPIGELATQTDALRYPGTHEALQPAHLLPCPQGRKPLSPSEQQVVLNALKRVWGEGTKRLRRLFRGVRLVNQGREACAITHVTDVPSQWHAFAIEVAQLRQ